MNFDDNFTKTAKKWLSDAKKLNKTIVLPEAGFSERMVNAGLYCAENKIANIVFLVKNDEELSTYDLSKYDNIKIVNYRNHELLPVLASALYLKRKDKGLTEKEAFSVLYNSPVYFATMMVELGLVDGLVSGAETPSKDTFLPAFQIVKGKQGKKASSFFIMLPKNQDDKIYLVGDCAINGNPTSEDLAEFACDSTQSMKTLVGVAPKVALLSYSTLGSGVGEDAENVRNAAQLVKDKNVDFVFDGEIQLDAAIDATVAKLKCPNSALKGDANVLIFPDLQSGNIGYKLMQRFGNFTAVGPIVQGLNKPINDVSRGASVSEIVQTIAITCLQ